MTTATITLTADQQAAMDSFLNFLCDPIETVFVLKGYSGCGKSTLVKILLEALPGFMKTARLINPQQREYQVELTATTNKAAENLARITGEEVRTIHSILGLRVETDFKTGVTNLIPRNQAILENHLLFVDEFSYIDKQLLSYIFSRTRNSKIVFVGDPAQLTLPKSNGVPVEDANFNGAALTEVVRQAKNNPIIELSTKFRETVNTGEFFSFTPDGHHVQYMTRDDFNEKIKQEFGRPDWKYSDSKILAWTNKCVISYNQYVRNHVLGDPHFQTGDYAVCNSFLSMNKQNIKTDQMVEITLIYPDEVMHGVLGNYMILDHSIKTFMPKSRADKNTRIKLAKASEDFWLVAEIENTWVDLRAAYAATVNKSQGSTFDEVFIDLDDISRCNSANQLARMLYVAVSRARNHVYLCGDII